MQRRRGNRGKRKKKVSTKTGTTSGEQEKSTPPLVKEQKPADCVTGTAPKPWSCNRARLFVKESNKERPKRLVRYAKEKQAAVNGIMRAPYVEVGWALPDGTCRKRRGLFDTGADWSIIKKDALRQDELRAMKPTLMEGQGVCKETLPIIGEIWSDLYLGDVLIKNHRFIVFVDTHEGEFFTKFANLGDQEVRIRKGEPVAVLKDDTNPVVLNCARAFQPKQACFDWDSNLGKNLNGKQRGQLRELLKEMSGVFYDGGKLPLVQIGIEHKIRVKEDSAPMAQRPRRLGQDMEEEVRAEIQDLVRMGVIRQSNSAWAAPVVCSRRANGKLRLALAYRGPNKVSSPANLHPIPRMDDLMDRLGDAKFYSTLDAKAGYHQIASGRRRQ